MKNKKSLWSRITINIKVNKSEISNENKKVRTKVILNCVELVTVKQYHRNYSIITEKWEQK